MKIVFFSLLTILPLLPARSLDLEENLIMDTENVVEKMISCPGDMAAYCILFCYKVYNENTSKTFSCDMEATGYFRERITTSTGYFYSGNKLTAVDYRTLLVYPYQTAEICFNFGKQTRPVPEQPALTWVFWKSKIVGECQGF